MNNTEKRLDAAQMLGIEPGATPRAANIAYVRRMKQFIDLKSIDDNDDMNDFSRKVVELYDARTVMSYPQNKQALSSIKLALADETHKKYNAALVMIMLCRNKSNNASNQALLKECSKLLKQVYAQYRAFRALGLYDLSALWGIVMYEHNYGPASPWAALAVYGSMMIATLAIGGLMVSMDKKKEELSRKLHDAGYFKMFKNK